MSALRQLPICLDESLKFVDDAVHFSRDLAHSGLKDRAVLECNDSPRSYFHQHVRLVCSDGVVIEPQKLCVRLEVVGAERLDVFFDTVDPFDDVVGGTAGNGTDEPEFSMFIMVRELSEPCERMFVEVGNPPLIRLMALDDAHKVGINTEKVTRVQASKGIGWRLIGAPSGDDRELDPDRLVVTEGLWVCSSSDELPSDVVKGTPVVGDGVSRSQRPVGRNRWGVCETEGEFPMLRIVHVLGTGWRIGLIRNPLPGVSLKLGKMMVGPTQFLQSIYEHGHEFVAPRAL